MNTAIFITASIAALVSAFTLAYSCRYSLIQGVHKGVPIVFTALLLVISICIALKSLVEILP